MENERNIIYKIVFIIIIILCLMLIISRKANCEEEKDYVNMSKLDVLKELLIAKHEIVELKNELNETSDLLIQEKERTKLLADKLIQSKEAMNVFIEPNIVQEKTWNDYFHLYAKLNYLTMLNDLTSPGLLISTGFMVGGFYNLWLNCDVGYSYLKESDFRLNTGVMFWY